MFKKFRAGVPVGQMRGNIVGLIASIALMGISLFSAEQLKLNSEEMDRRRVFVKE